MSPQQTTPLPQGNQALATQVALLQQSVEALREQIGDWISRTDTMMADQRQQTAQLREQWLSSNLEGRVGNIEQRLVKLEETVAGMKPAIQLLTFVATALGGLIVALLWAVLTGQATIAFGG